MSHDPSGWTKNELQRIRCLSGGGGLRASYRCMRMFHQPSLSAIVFVLTSDVERAGKLAVGSDQRIRRAPGTCDWSGGASERARRRVFFSRH